MSTSGWIRVSNDLAEHPKSQLLANETGEPFAWALMVRLWSWMGDYADSGLIPARMKGIAERAAGWTGSPGALLAAAVKTGFADWSPASGGGDDADWMAHDWEEFQGRALREAKARLERMRTYRRNRRLAKTEKNTVVMEREPHACRNGDASVTPNGTVRYGTEESKPKDTYVAAATPVLAAHETLQQVWNDTRHPSLPKWVETPKGRQKAAKVALKSRSVDGPGGWREVIERINASSFLRGETVRGWRANPDWLLRQGVAAKVLEGQYDDPRGTSPPKPGTLAVVSNVWGGAWCAKCDGPAGYEYEAVPLCWEHLPKEARGAHA